MTSHRVFKKIQLVRNIHRDSISHQNLKFTASGFVKGQIKLRTYFIEIFANTFVRILIG